MQTEDIQLDREDIILMILEANERILRKSTLNGRTRLVKLVFLLEHETSFEGIGTFFQFEPHNYGPFSKDVYEATDFLEGCELIGVKERVYPSPYASSDEDKLISEISDDEEQVSSLATEMCFSLTENGRKIAKIMRDSVMRKKPTDVVELDSIVQKYGAIPLNHLIRYVYHQYPEMTSNSVHPEAANVNPNNVY